jgi:hypothetical protein
MRGVSTVALAVAATIVATGNGTAINVGDFHGIALAVLNSGAANAGTDVIKLEHSDNGTDGWEDAGITFTAVGTSASYQEVKFNADKLKKFVRVVDTLAGGANSVTRSVTLVGKKQYA